MFKTENAFERRIVEPLSRAVTNSKALIAIFTIAMVVVSVIGLGSLQISTNYRAFFGPGNQDLADFEEFEATYSRNDNFLFALQAVGEPVASKRTLTALHELTQAAWHIPSALRVDSLTNFQNTTAIEDDLVVQDLFADPRTMTSDEIDWGLQTALDEPLLRDKLISRDASTVGANITLQYSGDDLSEVSEATAAAREIKQNIEEKYPGIRVALTGVSALNNAFAESTIQDAVTLFPLMFIVLTIVIWFVVRSVAGTIASLTIVTLSTLGAMGFAGFAGIAISPFSGSAPVVILTLALADCMHIFISAKSHIGTGSGKVTAVRHAYQENFLPVTITSLTTIIGFLALNFSDAPPFNDLGNIVAAGIFLAWLLSLTLFPVLLIVMPMGAPKTRLFDRLMAKKLDLSLVAIGRFYKPIIVIGGVALLFLGVNIRNIELNDPWVDYFDEKVEFRVDTEFVMDNLTGLYLVEFSIDAAEVGGVNHPEYLELLDRFSTWLRARPDVSHVQSYSDTMKRINRTMHGDDNGFYRIPDSSDEASQYLLLYEMSLPYGLDMNDRISIDRTASRLTVTLPEISTQGVRDFVSQSQVWLDREEVQVSTVVTGAPVLFARISERNINDMFSGNLVAVLLIALTIALALWNFRLGMMSLIPNVIPIIATFGIWASLVGEVGMAAATVSATSLGIIVDNTVHLLLKYQKARKSFGLEGFGAVEYALKHVGQAVIVNTIILIAGFGVLALSTFRVTGQMGSLTALVIGVAFVVDLILLPAILLYFANRKINSKEGEPNHAKPQMA
ncbi:MAG: RND transporter [Alphaproteobacteria bacterium]|nr:MAG: RND transporter [Alphaproteobacteria bacterium]